MSEDLYHEITLEVLEEIKPDNAERKRLEKEYFTLKESIEEILIKNNISGMVELSGSFSRDTWLAGSRDLDIFVILPRESPIEPQELLTVLEKNIQLPWQRKHAAHPYLYAEKDDFAIEILPAYKYHPGKDLRSAVDRSPAHKLFVSDNLPTGANDEVRLFKKFLKGIGLYGAEIEVHGFSGYLTELLIIHFGGTFLEVLRNAASLRNKIITFKEELIVDPAEYSNEPLIVIDPTDDTRNVASALSEKSLNGFIAAATLFLDAPSKKFFFPQEITYSPHILDAIRTSHLYYTGLIYPRPQKVVDDVLWGQIHRFERGVFDHLIRAKIKALTIASKVTETEIFTIIVTAQETTNKFVWRLGPPIKTKGVQKLFFEKYMKNSSLVFGPIIQNERWKILVKEDSVLIADFLKQAILTKQIPLPSHLSISEEVVFGSALLLERLKNDKEKLVFLYKKLQGKPSYLQ